MAGALADLGPTAVPRLVELLDAKDPRVREAAESLGNFGIEARPAIPRLLECLDDLDNFVTASDLSKDTEGGGQNPKSHRPASPSVSLERSDAVAGTQR